MVRFDVAREGAHVASTPSAWYAWRMPPQEYKRIAAQLEMRPSWVMTSLTAAMWVATLGAGGAMLQRGGVSWYIGSQLVLAVGMFQGFCIVHECGHGSFSRSRFLNHLVGHIASASCAQPFLTWKYIHQEHHAWAGHESRDPVVARRNEWRAARRAPILARVAWRSFLPLLAALQHLVYWTYPLKLAREGSAESRRRAWACLASLLVMLSLMAVAIAVSTGLGWSVNVGGAVLLYLVGAELVNLPHHTDLASYPRRLPLREQWLVTRSCDYPPLVSEICVLNFNFHIEHHLFPALPWYRLRLARRLVRAQLGQHYRESLGIGWNLANRTRPLVDVIVGGDRLHHAEDAGNTECGR